MEPEWYVIKDLEKFIDTTRVTVNHLMMARNRHNNE
jgi:hypothetical protein